ncbi:MAG: CvpA family protein [Cytophagales bacterium]
MEVIDIVLALPLLFGFYRGFKKGLLMEIVNILALILAIIGGFKLMDQALLILIDTFGKPHPAFPFLAFILVFIAIVLGVNVLGKALKSLIGLTILGSFDKFVGGIIGVIKWAFAISLVLWMINAFAPELFDEQMRTDAYLLPLLISFAPHLFHIMLGFLPFLSDMMDSIKDLLSPDSVANY